MRVKRPQGQGRRRGVILLVVLAMLTLLTVIGVTFVLYSDSAESTARIAMEGEKTILPDFRTDELMAYAFGQLIYDVEDDDAGQRSGMRGHSLARDMYGYYYDQTSGPLSSSSSSTPTPSKAPDNDRPFRGTGRLDSEKDKINFTTFKSSTNTNQIRDPERPGSTRAATSNPNSYFGGFNPPYTYPDTNHVFLAKTKDEGSGTPTSIYVEMPSFVRQPLATTDWSTPASPTTDLHLKSIRPRPVDHNNQFPPLASPTGDVRNLPWGTQNDSVWIDLGVPPKTAPNGKRYKPLFAFLAIDLDGRVNLNAHGNIHGRDAGGNWSLATARHASGQGWGPWEVSVQRALSSNPMAINTVETNWLNLFKGLGSVVGRQAPSGLVSIYDIGGGSLPHLYAPVNYNGSVEPGGIGGPLDQPIMMPGSGVSAAFSPFGVGNPTAFGMGVSAERSQAGTAADASRIHGALFHPFVNYFNPSTNQYNRKFEDSHLGVALARNTRNPTIYLNSDLVKLNLFSSPPFIPASSSRDRKYDWLTTMSWDLDRPGISPYFTYDSAMPSLTQLTAPQLDPTTMTSILNSRPSNTAQPNIMVALPGEPPAPGPFVPAKADDRDPKGRAKNPLAAISRLNLNRPLTPFPAINPATGQYVGMGPPDTTAILSERENFARELFESLVAATGAMHPLDPNAGTVFTATPPTDPKYFATRMLAQLAANIVDNLDVDDVMTSFKWNTVSDVVYGTELSRLALNEVYVQLENPPGELAAGSNGDPLTNFNVKIYVELLNPTPSDTSTGGVDYDNDYSPWLNSYRVSLFSSGVGPGKYDPFALDQTEGVVGGIPLITSGPLLPLGGDRKVAPNQAVVLGPTPNAMSSEITNPFWNPANPGFADCQLSFSVPADKKWEDFAKITMNYDMVAPNKRPVLVMQRLLDPHLPASATNPLVVVDFLHITPEMIARNDARQFIVDPADMNKSIANPGKVVVGKRHSFARPQPYAYLPPVIGLMRDGNDSDGSAIANFPSYKKEYGSLVPSFLDPATPPTDQPHHTFGRNNFTNNQGNPGTNISNAPFFNRAPGGTFGAVDFNPQDTMETPFPRVHLDRIVASPTELMSTSLYRPHEFAVLNTAQFAYCSPWFETNSRLYRWLEWVQAGDTRGLAVAGSSPPTLIPVGSPGGRIPGKINLNTVSREAFHALCDAQQGNRFNDSQIYALYDQVAAMRPFWGNAAGTSNGMDLFSVNPRGRHQTIFSNHPAGVGPDAGDQLNLLMDPLHQAYNGGPLLSANGLVSAGMAPPRPQEFHPSVRLELLNKIFSRTTSRSNCFAVWLTVGFFEVTREDGGSAVAFQPSHILGKELEPKIRRRFFAMIDRTNLEKWHTNLLQSSGVPYAVSVDDPTRYPYRSAPMSVPLSDLYYKATTTSAAAPITSGVINSQNNKIFQISLGSLITLDPGDIQLEETVEVVDIGMGIPGIICKKAHPNGLIASSRGNPGPMPNLGLDYRIQKDTDVVPYIAVLE